MKMCIILILLFSLGITTTYGYEGHPMSDEEMMLEQKGVGICPVMGGSSSKEFSYTYEGKTYYFCCAACIEEFKKNPQKYISKIKDIKLEAYQYGFSPDPVVVKKDDIVRLQISSRDVTHGMYIKEYGINVSVKKGEVEKVEFLADKAGKFDIICSVYCGPGHSEMKGKFIVEEK